jgi:hypothetical protein
MQHVAFGDLSARFGLRLSARRFVPFSQGSSERKLKC